MSTTADALNPAAVREAALRMLRDVMDDDTESPLARRQAAEALLKHVSEEVADETNARAMDLSDDELARVILDWREEQAARAAPPAPAETVAASAISASPEVPRETSLAERLRLALADLPEDPLCQ